MYYTDNETADCTILALHLIDDGFARGRLKL